MVWWLWSVHGACSPHHYLIIAHFCHLNPVLISSCYSPILQPLATARLLSVSMDLLILSISHKPNPSERSPLCLPWLGVVPSGIILVEVGVNPASFFSVAEFSCALALIFVHPLSGYTRALAVEMVVLCVCVWRLRFQPGCRFSVFLGTKQEGGHGVSIPIFLLGAVVSGPICCWLPAPTNNQWHAELHSLQHNSKWLLRMEWRTESTPFVSGCWHVGLLNGFRFTESLP